MRSAGEHGGLGSGIDAFSRRVRVRALARMRAHVRACVFVFLVIPGNRTSYLPEREGLSPGRRPTH